MNKGIKRLNQSTACLKCSIFETKNVDSNARITVWIIELHVRIEKLHG